MTRISAYKIIRRWNITLSLIILLVPSSTFSQYQTSQVSPIQTIAKLLLEDKINANYDQFANEVHNIKPERFQPQAINNKDSATEYQYSSCQLVQVFHLLHHPGCQPKAIASFACSGSCPSYVQTSSSKFWQHERSCSCCQHTGIREATFTLDCPSLDVPYKKVKTFAPVDCLCRTCTDLAKENLQPQELVEALAAESPGLISDKSLLPTH